MDNNIRFVTLYPRCHNAGLMKDVGQIPNTLGNNYKNIDAALVSCILDLQDPNIRKLTGMRIEDIPFILNNDFLTGLIYIWKYAKNVDWFNFYHGGRRVYYWTKLYKWLNPNGKVYLKMDLSYEGCENCRKSKKELKIFERTAKAVDVISVESEVIQKLALGFSKADIQLICNGYFDTKNLHVKKTSDRKREFLTVGRLGTPPKNTELLLEAFYQSSDKHDWNLRLVGPVDPSFEGFRSGFFNSHPGMKERVIFDGEVNEKEKLYEIYNSARVFVLPSRWEGFPLVGPEAAHCGCRMILTEIIPPIKELTNDSMFGTSVKTNDVGALADALLHEAQRETEDLEPLRISNYADEVLAWDGICRKLLSCMGVSGVEYQK